MENHEALHGFGSISTHDHHQMDCRDAVVGGLSYVGGRLTAPVSGDEGKDKEVADKAKANVNKGADKLSNAGQETREKVPSLSHSAHT